jgi:hypothetical protein
VADAAGEVVEQVAQRQPIVRQSLEAAFDG